MDWVIGGWKWLCYGSAGGVLAAAETGVDFGALADRFGLPVIALGLLATGRFVVPRFIYDRSEKRGDYWQEHALEQAKQWNEKVLPALLDVQKFLIEERARRANQGNE